MGSVVINLFSRERIKTESENHSEQKKTEEQENKPKNTAKELTEDRREHNKRVLQQHKIK